MEKEQKLIFNKIFFYFFVQQSGNSAEYYTNHEQSDKILSHKQLLSDYGADEKLAEEMLNDQGMNN